MVTDFMGKPTAMLSERDHGKLSSVATYDAFGAVNRGELVKIAEQPGKTSLGSTLFAVGSQEQSQARILMDQMPAGSWFRVNIDSSEVYYSDEPPGYGWTDWSPEVIGTGQKDIEAELSSSGAALTTRVVEYRRSEAGVPYVFTNMRFPGQWYDPETDFHENWHRFYSPETGQYLSPEPMLQKPLYLRQTAQDGMSVPTFAYAANNPLKYTDPTGLDVYFHDEDGIHWSVSFDLSCRAEPNQCVAGPQPDPMVLKIDYWCASKDTDALACFNGASAMSAKVMPLSLANAGNNFNWTCKADCNSTAAALAAELAECAKNYKVIGHNCRNVAGAALAAAGCGFPHGPPGYY